MRNCAIGCLVLFAMAGTAFSETKEPPKELAVDLGEGVKLDLVLIPAGSFTMGDDSSTIDAKPAHKVTITKPFYLGKYEVTQEQWEAVMGSNPSHFKGRRTRWRASVGTTARSFLLSSMRSQAGKEASFVLPTEAQWEYACRAGSTTRFSYGDDANSLGEYAWCKANSRGHDAPGGREEAECLGVVRHARKRMGVVLRLVRKGLLRELAFERSHWADNGL